MKPLRLLCCSVFLMAAGWFGAGCQSSSGGGSAPEVTDYAPVAPVSSSSSVLKVGVTPDIPPMVFEQGGQLTGFEIELAKELGKKIGKSVQFIPVAWEDQINYLNSGRTDIIMSSMSITQERQMLVAFSNPYMRVGQMMLIHRADQFRYALGIPQPLPGTVGVQRGTVGEYLMESQFSNSKRKSYRSVEDAVGDLVDRKIQIVVSDAQLVWYQAALNEANGLAVVPRLLNTDYLGWAMRAGDTELLGKVNAFLLEKQTNGTLNASIKRWMPLWQ